MKAIVIIAHPDDEVIWMGGYILRHKNYRWHVIAVCYGDNANRAYAFTKSCNKLGIYTHKIFNYPDNHVQINENSLKADLSRVVNQWQELDGNFNYIFTHNKDNGEYGHEVHKRVGQVVFTNKNEVFANEAKLFQFNYGTEYPQDKTKVEVSDYERYKEGRMEVAPNAVSTSSKYLFLRHDELRLKLDILSSIYTAQRADFKNLSWPCPNPESFIAT